MSGIDPRTGLPLGELPEGDESAGRAGVSYLRRHPLCRGRCTSRDRAAHDSPAKTGIESGTGRKVVWCPCCNRELRRLPEGAVVNERPANLNPALVAGRFVRFEDPICQFEVVLLFDVKEAG